MTNQSKTISRLASGLREAPVSCWSGISGRSMSGVEIVGQTLREGSSLDSGNDSQSNPSNQVLERNNSKNNNK